MGSRKHKEAVVVGGPRRVAVACFSNIVLSLSRDHGQYPFDRWEVCPGKKKSYSSVREVRTIRSPTIRPKNVSG